MVRSARLAAAAADGRRRLLERVRPAYERAARRGDCFKKDSCVHIPGATASAAARYALSAADGQRECTECHSEVIKT